jgi:hypothetical protein
MGDELACSTSVKKQRGNVSVVDSSEAGEANLALLGDSKVMGHRGPPPSSSVVVNFSHHNPQSRASCPVLRSFDQMIEMLHSIVKKMPPASNSTGSLRTEQSAPTNEVLCSTFVTTCRTRY